MFAIIGVYFQSLTIMFRLNFRKFDPNKPTDYRSHQAAHISDKVEYVFLHNKYFTLFSNLEDTIYSRR